MNNFWKIGTIILAVILLFGLLVTMSVYFGKHTLKSLETTRPATMRNPIDVKANLLKQIDVEVSSHKGGFGSIMIGSASIKNRNKDIDVKDIVITCDIFGKSGTKIDEISETVFEVFPAKSHKTIKEINFGFVHSQSSSFSCFPSDLTVK